MASRIIKNGETISIKINRKIVVSVKFANIYEFFDNIKCDDDVL